MRWAAVMNSTTAGPATRILIVDQDRQVGVSLSAMLSERGYEDIRTVRSAKRALSITEQFRPEIVFLALELSDDSGIIVARQLTRNVRNLRPRLIALTKHAEQPAREEARAAGFERFLTIPVLQEELDKVLATGRTTR